MKAAAHLLESKKRDKKPQISKPAQIIISVLNKHRNKTLAFYINIYIVTQKNTNKFQNKCFL